MHTCFHTHLSRTFVRFSDKREIFLNGPYLFGLFTVITMTAISRPFETVSFRNSHIKLRSAHGWLGSGLVLNCTLTAPRVNQIMSQWAVGKGRSG